MEELHILILFVIFIGGVSFYFFLWKNRKAAISAVETKEDTEVSSAVPSKKEKKKHNTRKDKELNAQKAGFKAMYYEEKKGYLQMLAKKPLYVNVCRGFLGEITCVAFHPKRDVVAASCLDTTIRVFDISEEQFRKSSNIPYTRIVIENDYMTSFDFSYDGNCIVGATESDRCLLILKIAKNEGENKNHVIYKGDKPLQKNTVRWLFASQRKWIVTASEDDDTEINVWSYSGERLASYNTKQVKNLQLSVSPIDSRFVMAASWSPGVKLMEIKAKSDNFHKLDKAMDLKSLKGIKSVCVSFDNKYALTVDKGGSFTLWNINVRYNVSEDPKIILSFEETDERFKDYSFLSFTFDNKNIIGVANNNIKIMNSKNLQNVEVIECAHSHSIRTLAVSKTSPFFLTGALDNRPRIWTLPGYRNF